MAQVLFDKMVYVDTLKNAGVAEGQARAQAHALDLALHESVATKGDITSLKTDIALVRKDMEVLAAEFSMLQRIVLGIGVSLGVGIALLVIKAFL